MAKAKTKTKKVERTRYHLVLGEDEIRWLRYLTGQVPYSVLNHEIFTALNQFDVPPGAPKGTRPLLVDYDEGQW